MYHFSCHDTIVFFTQIMYNLLDMNAERVCLNSVNSLLPTMSV